MLPTEITQPNPTEIVGIISAIGVLLTQLVLQISKIVGDWRRDKRDQRNDEQKQRTLERIADSNEKQLVFHAEVKAALQLSGRIGDMRYAQIISEIQKACRHPSLGQMSQQKKEAR
jgi:hypothetical protein